MLAQRAVMKEILRITFPVGSRLPMICHEEIEFHDWKIPAHVGGTRSVNYYIQKLILFLQTPMSVNHRNLLFDPTVFIEPHKFSPERWLNDKDPIDEKRYFVVFGKGGRVCPGKGYVSLLRLLTIMSNLK